MKVYPKEEENPRKKKLAQLSKKDQALRFAAILLAFLSIFAFVVKILFL